ncbi:MAG TPA: leucyl aminopeptidase family protein, partial [Beijerinckiaceae bacterium]|nr:leucyl aminopeptidase family protein [Beijerinckiaceae bacterium]
MLHPSLIARRPAGCRPIHLVTAEGWPALAASLSATARGYAEVNGFQPKPGRTLILPNAEGTIEAVVMGIDPAGTPGSDPFVSGSLAATLPEGDYAFDTVPAGAELATLAFLMACYRFDRYKAAEPCRARLVVPKGVDGARVSRIAAAVAMGRDLINTPAADLG